MERSYNGWTASTSAKDFGGLDNRAIAGVRMAPGVRAGDVATVLFYVAEQFHLRVEKLVDGWCWGFSYRQNRNAANLSCHSSATAIDLNAPRHPNGKRGTFTKAQVAEIRKILAQVGGAVRWGGDFTGTPDEMHFEVIASPATLAMIADRLGDKATPISPITILPAVPAQPEGFLMALNDDQQAKMYNLIVQRLEAPIPNQVLDALVGGAGGGQALWANVSQIRADLGMILAALAARPTQVTGITRDELSQAIADAVPADIAADVASRLRVVAA